MKKSSRSKNRPAAIRQTANATAFSLLEIIAVMAVISILAVVGAPAIASVSGANGTIRAVGEVGNALEYARQVAMQTGTWVWVGMENSSQSGAEERITIVTVASKDGSSDMSEQNLSQLRPVSHVDRVKLSSEGKEEGFVLGSEQGDFTFHWKVPSSEGAKSMNFSNFVLGFSPRGEAMAESSNVRDWICVIVKSPTNSKDCLSVLVSGSSGQVVVSR